MTTSRTSHRFSLRLPLLLPLTVAIVCAALLWMALLPAAPAQAAPHAVIDENIAIVSVTHLDLHANDIVSDPFRNVLARLCTLQVSLRNL